LKGISSAHHDPSILIEVSGLGWIRRWLGKSQLTAEDDKWLTSFGVLPGFLLYSALFARLVLKSKALGVTALLISVKKKSFLLND